MSQRSLDLESSANTGADDTTLAYHRASTAGIPSEYRTVPSGAGSEASFDPHSQNGPEDGRWKSDTKKSYNSADGIYFVMPWKLETGSDFHRVRVPWRVGLLPSDNKSSAARERELKIVIENLQKSSVEDRDRLLDGIDTDRGRTMIWKDVKEHFKKVWPEEGEVEFRLAQPKSQTARKLQERARETLPAQAAEEAQESQTGSKDRISRRNDEENRAIRQEDANVKNGGSWVARW